MLNYDELDKKFIVEYDEDKTCMFAYLWDKRDFPNHNVNEPGWISVSEVYKKCLEHKWHFYPAGWYRDTLIAGYELNETFGECTDDLRALYVVGKKVTNFLRTQRLSIISALILAVNYWHGPAFIT